MTRGSKLVPLKHACVGKGEYGLNISASAYSAVGVRMLRTTDLRSGRLTPDDDGIFIPEHAVTPDDLLAAHDLLLSRSGTIGRAFLTPPEAAGMAFAGFLVRFRPRADVSPKYLFYCTQSTEFQAQVSADAISSTIQNFNADRYGNIRIPLPSHSEQRAIAEYLDRETAQIDTLIAKQEQLITTLRERRASSISSAVLGSFRPLAGDQVGAASVGSMFTVILGKMLDAGRPPTNEDVELPYIRAANIQDGGLDLASINSMAYTPREADRLDLRVADLLVVEGGSIGTSVLLRDDMPGWSFQKTVNRVRAVGPNSTAWLGYVLRTYRDSGVIATICSGSTIAHFTAEKLRALRIPATPPAEQARIAAELDEVTSKIDMLIAKAERFIELAKERRAGLITAAVTGRIEVPAAS